MKRIFLLSSIVLCLSCKNIVFSPLDTNLLKTDWLASDSLYLYVEDSLMISNIHPYLDFFVYKYNITNDSLNLKPILPSWEKSSFFEITFQILKLNTTELNLKLVKCSKEFFPIKLNQTLIFMKDSIKNNDLKIKTLEFSSSRCFGSCPAVDLKISEDSIIFLKGFAFTKHKGLYHKKLSKIELDRITRKINRVRLDDISLEKCPIDAQNYSILIQTKMLKDYECSGCFDYKNSFDLKRLFFYLIKLDLLLDYNKSTNEDIPLKYSMNEN